MKEQAYEQLLEKFRYLEPSEIVKVIANYMSSNELEEFVEYCEDIGL